MREGSDSRPAENARAGTADRRLRSCDVGGDAASIRRRLRAASPLRD